MAGGKEPIEVKFRLFDGTDIGPSKYDPSTTVAALKEFVLARWPQGEETLSLVPLRAWRLLLALLIYIYMCCSALLMPPVSGGCLFGCPALADPETRKPPMSRRLLCWGIRSYTVSCCGVLANPKLIDHVAAWIT